jgi:two-component system, OmpR family, KDP operon response regulator KdpE
MAQGATILVAEDNEVLQRLVKQTLECAGYIVVQAFSGAELNREVERAAPDLIVLDIGLPDADGRDILARLKKDPKTTGIPVVVWSGRDTPSDRRIALELGAEDYVEKGPPSRLVGKIERLLLRLRLQA